ncbi:MAG: helix-turn-helix domain-containing protein [Candidatus Aenigmatarchaeota archaeon]
MTGGLLDIINGNLLGDACVRVWRGKYFYYKHTAKDKRYLEWLADLLDELRVTIYIVTDNPKAGTYALGFYINKSRVESLLNLRKKWYRSANGKTVKIIPEDIELNPTVLLHWYLGDGSLVRQKGNRVPRIVLATNNFSKQYIDFLIEKLRDIGLNFYPLQSFSGFKNGAKCGRVLISKTSDGTPFRFFKLIGIRCPEEIKKCFTGNKGRGSKRHYFGGKWPNEEDWLRTLHNAPIGKIIKERRVELGMSQGQLARKVKIGKNTIKRVERGVRYPGVSLFRKLLNTLKINPLYLLELIGD